MGDHCQVIFITALDERQLPDIRLHRFGFIFQDFNLLAAHTAQENVALVAEIAGVKAAAARAAAACSFAEPVWSGLAASPPTRTALGRGKQRGAIARAFVNDPMLILADEPTANLDSRIGHEVMRLLRGIGREQGRSVVIVSHDQRIKEIADRVLWLEDGQLASLTATEQVVPVIGERPMKPDQERVVESRITTPLDHATTTQTNRRSLLRHGLTIGLAAPFVIPGSRAFARQDSHGSDETGTPDPSAEHAPTSANDEHVEAPVPAEPARPFARYDPVLQPVESGPKDITVVAADATLLIAKDVPFAGWTYDGTIPGRTFRVVEGDTVNVTFRIDSSANAHHSLDFHSAKTPPDVNFRTIDPGEEFSWSFVAKHPGAYMYHCGTPQILMHVGAGMYGAMIVNPKEGWSPAQELILVQSEFYVTDGRDGIKVPDYERMIGNNNMDYVVFNGYANQYVDNPIPVRAGEPIRIFVVNTGPNVWSSFHVVGTIFDRAYINASPKNELFDLQSITIGPGDSACVEFTLDEPGIYTAVNHAFGHAAHGAVALLRAE